MRSEQLKYLFIIILVFPLTLPLITNAQSLNQKLQMARQLENQGRLQNAQELLETLYQDYPNNRGVFSQYSDILMKTQSFQKLLDLIREKENKGKIIPEYSLLKARTYYRQGKYDEALHTWDTLLQQNASDRLMYYKVASSMITERLLEEALKVYLEGRKKFNNDDLFSLNIVNIYEALRQYKEATEELIQYLHNHPQSMTIVEAKLLRFQGSDQIITTVSISLKQAIKKQPENTQLKELLLKYYIQAEYFQEGWKTVRTFFPANKQNNENILFMFAENAYKAGSPQIAEKAYKTILKTDSHFIPVENIYLGLARTLEAQKNYRDAVHYYELVYLKQKKSPVAIQAQIQRARILKEQLHEFKEAAAMYNSLIKQPLEPQKLYNCRFSLGECLIAQGEIEKAKKMYLEIEEEFRADKNQYWIKAIVSLGKILYFQGEFEAALHYLNQLSIYDIEEKYLSEESLNNGLNLRMLIRHYWHDSAEPLRLLARAEYYETRGDYDKAIVSLDSIITDNTDSNLVPYGLLKKGSLLITLKQYNKSIATLEQFLEQYPSHHLTDKALERMGWLYQQEGKSKQATAYYEDLLTNFPSSLLKEEVRLRIRSLEKKEP